MQLPRPRGKRIGLLGGSFNPAHAGHLYISRMALRLLKLDEVWWLVSPQNPLKDTAGMAALEARIHSAKRLARDSRIRPLALETELGTRYTVDTLRALKSHFPLVQFVWLMGADNLVQLPRWKHWQEIFRLVPVAVFDRAPFTLRALSSRAAKIFARHQLPEGSLLARQRPPAWVYLEIPRHPASSTAIRRAGKS